MRKDRRKTENDVFRLDDEGGLYSKLKEVEGIAILDVCSCLKRAENE